MSNAITLGDFFASAPLARPVNPRPVTFTAVAKGDVLPGGTRNPHGVPVASTITAAFVFMGGDGAEAARIDARRSLRARFVDPETKIPLPIDEIDLGCETLYQEAWRVLYEWDASVRRTGKRLFDSVDLLRELVEVDEIRRILRKYNEYVAQEHPEVVDEETFRDAPGGGASAPGRAPR